ncbi:lactate utilization protein C [Streptomyces sp. G1]|uniref:LutC/YkgG family protein n=1 Tax=Streptomyces sp. G1 TaxID=361572 RepID=UPI0020300D0E|nr:lactate utilization protein C [Streptomyces sp. G1]MCM1966283.1 lactate utilization protein C [Streptomyces sp. G1]
MTGRDTVLARITEALRDVPPTETAEDTPVPRRHRTSHAEGDVATLFAERVADYRATVTRTAPDGAAAVIADVLHARGATRVVLPAGFPAELLPAPGPDPARTWLGDGPRLSVDALDGADAVLTTAAAGIAVTGTIVLDGGPGQGRRALTLLPDLHVCVVREDQIGGDVPEVLALMDPTAPLTFISGPSATSDIELDRVEGVHGPRTLHVIVIATPKEDPS